MKHLFLGSGIAGISAAEEIRRRDGTAEIVMIADEKFYFRAALSKYFKHEIDRDEVWGKPDGWYETNGIGFKETRAVRVDTEGHIVECYDGSKESYDRLLIATGAVPFVLNWPGLDLEGVCTYRGLGCVEKFMRFIDAGARKVVVIGGGILSFELIEDFLKYALEVTLLVRGSKVLDLLFDDLGAEILARHLSVAGVDIRFTTEAEKIVGEGGKVTGLVTKDGETIPCDMVAAAIGIKPDKELSERSGISFDRSILVDRHMNTSAPDVYAAGDCCAVETGQSGGYAPTRTWLTCALQGRTAARNMLGGDEIFDEGVFFNVSHVFTSFYAVMGVFNPRDAEDYEFKTWQFGKQSYMRWTIKDGRVVGAIVLNASKYIWPVRQLIDCGIDISGVLDEDITAIDLHQLLPQEKQVLF